MGKAIHILVVEDQPVQCVLLQRMLSHNRDRWEIDMALSARDALDMLRGDRYDLLVTDLSLPGVDGITLSRAARAQDREISIIWMTACGCYRFGQEAEQLGVHACLDKPARMDQIRATVCEALKERREGRA